MAKNKKRKINWLVVATILVFLIPGAILGYVLVDSMENAHEPVVESRFKNELDPKITNEQLEQVKAAMNFPEVEHVSVDLISATLRVNLDFNNNLYPEQVAMIVNEAYERINQILPIKTYFTNHNGIKMYDLEINGYDIIPNDPQDLQGNPIYIVKTKTGAAKEPTMENVRLPKNQEVSDQMLKNSEKLKQETNTQQVVQPDTGQPFTNQP